MNNLKSCEDIFLFLSKLSMKRLFISGNSSMQPQLFFLNLTHFNKNKKKGKHIYVTSVLLLSEMLRWSLGTAFVALVT